MAVDGKVLAVIVLNGEVNSINWDLMILVAELVPETECSNTSGILLQSDIKALT